jgi:hypothetical protein
VTAEWDAYQKCQVCFAELGKPCWELVGFVAADGVATGLEGGVVEVAAEQPHSSRKLRARMAAA